MNNSVPSVTVLIAARPEQVEIKAVTASRVLDYPADKLEIIVARGKQPSIQRNVAISNDTVVWEDYRNNTHADVYAYFLDTGETRRISSGPGNHMHPSIDGPLVAWGSPDLVVTSLRELLPLFTR